MARFHTIETVSRAVSGHTLSRVDVANIAQQIRSVAAQRPPAGTVYTGSAGIGYALEYCGSRLSDEDLTTFGRSLARGAYAGVVQHLHHYVPTALLDGAAGVVLVKALLAPTATSPGTQPAEAAQYEQLCLEAAAAGSSTSEVSDEFLYGRAGTLFGALLLAQQLEPTALQPNVLQQLVNAILTSGRQLASRLPSCPTPLMYVWPPGRRPDPYLGAAHGLMGILYVLLHCGPQLEQDPGGWRDVIAALQYVLSLERDVAGREGRGGHYPVMMEQQQQPGAAEHDPLVHWCHGSPGAVLLFCKAAEVVPQLRGQCLAAARRAGELVWEQGVLRKGPGLCHGVAGNGYALLALYKATQEELWLQRAHVFGCWLVSPQGRADWGVPDHPVSLYEGLAGAACYLADLVVGPGSATFPLFELAPAGGKLFAAAGGGGAPGSSSAPGQW